MSGRMQVHRAWLPWMALILSICGMAWAGAASAQSLAELAKKEKERRAQVKSEGKARVITERDLGSYTRLPASAPSAPSDEAGGSTGQAQGAAQTGEEKKAPDETKTREYWQKRIEGVQQKIQKIETDLNNPELNWGGGVRTDVNPLGQKNLSRRQELEKQLSEARAELDAVREEARRAGIPAGWVR